MDEDRENQGQAGEQTKTQSFAGEIIMTSRDRFEKLMLKSWHADGFERDSDGMYCNPGVQGDWLEWQAAIVAEREACAKLCESMRPVGGRAWDEGQHAAFSALSEAEENIRARSQEEG